MKKYSPLVQLKSESPKYAWTESNKWNLFEKKYFEQFVPQVLQPKVLMQLRDDDVSFWHPGDTCTISL